MSAFDTNKPADICSISSKTPVRKPVEDFVEFYIPASCLIKYMAVMYASYPCSQFHKIKCTVSLHMAFHHSPTLSPPVVIMYSKCFACATYSNCKPLTIKHANLHSILLSLLLAVYFHWQPVSHRGSTSCSPCNLNIHYVWFIKWWKCCRDVRGKGSLSDITAGLFSGSDVNSSLIQWEIRGIGMRYVWQNMSFQKTFKLISFQSKNRNMA